MYITITQNNHRRPELTHSPSLLPPCIRFSGSFRFYSLDTTKYPEIATRLGTPSGAVASASIVDSKAGRHFSMWATGSTGEAVGKPAHRGNGAVWEVPRITYANLKDHLNAYRRDEYAQPSVTFGAAGASPFTSATLVYGGVEITSNRSSFPFLV